MPDARIALDAMGGDRAPRETVRGAVEAVTRDSDLEVVLIGDREAVERELGVVEEPFDASRLHVIHAGQVVASGDSPVEALKNKPDCSIKRAAELVAAGEVHGLVAAGNTGAAVAAGTLILRMIPGVRRPGIAVTLPNAAGSHTVLCDAGANIHCKPRHLFHYGVMASRYAERILDKAEPTLGLLNVGTEEGKGTDLVRDTAALFIASDLNFRGNMEGNDVFQGRYDVVVCEGFVGNVVLKTAEGLYEVIAKRLRETVEDMAKDAGNGSQRDLIESFHAHMDWAEYGGAPLLGVNGLVLISHGRSHARAIRNAVMQAARLQRGRFLQKMTEDLRSS